MEVLIDHVELATARPLRGGLAWRVEFTAACFGGVAWLIARQAPRAGNRLEVETDQDAVVDVERGEAAARIDSVLALGPDRFRIAGVVRAVVGEGDDAIVSVDAGGATFHLAATDVGGECDVGERVAFTAHGLTLSVANV